MIDPSSWPAWAKFPRDLKLDESDFQNFFNSNRWFLRRSCMEPYLRLLMTYTGHPLRRDIRACRGEALASYYVFAGELFGVVHGLVSVTSAGRKGSALACSYMLEQDEVEFISYIGWKKTEPLSFVEFRRFLSDRARIRLNWDAVARGIWPAYAV